MRSAASCSTLLALGLAACSPAPALLPVSPARPVLAVAAPVSPPPPIAATAAPAAPAEPAVALPPLIAGIDAPACTWATRRWRTRSGPTELRLRPGGPVFARVTGGRAQLQVPVGTPTDGLLSVGSSGLVVSGFVAREEVTLYAATEVALSGVVYPSAFMPLSYVQGTAGGVSITMSAPAGVLPGKRPLLATRFCEDVSLDRGAPLNPIKAAFGTTSSALQMTRDNRPLAVFSDPARPSEVQIALAPGTWVQSYASQGAFTRIGVYVGSTYVAGWVRTARLKPLQSQGSPGHASDSVSVSFGIGEGRRKPILQRICPVDVPLVAEAGGERRTVGYVRAQTLIDVIEVKGDFFRIAVKDRDVRPGIEGALLVRGADVEGC
jgi:hypothetical protein